MESGRHQTVKYESICTFKCEGCGKRFPATKLWKTSYRVNFDDPYTNDGKELRNHVCSQKCSSLASEWKRENNQTLDTFIYYEKKRIYPEKVIHKNSKLSDFDISTMRHLFAHGYKYAQLVKIFNVSVRHISYIVHCEKRVYV